MDPRPNPLPRAPENILDFQSMFATDGACATYLEEVRWPTGFVCPKCETPGAPYRHKARPGLLACRHCNHQASVTSGTIMHRSKQPLRLWFWAAYLVSTSTPGLSALQFQKQMGLKRYETAYQLLAKLRAGTRRPGQDKIGGSHAVELDVAFLGGVNKGQGRGVTKKALVAIAVEVREGEPPKNIRDRDKQNFYAGRIRMVRIPNNDAANIDKFVTDWIEPGSVILSDDGSSFTNLASLGYVHEPMVTKKDKNKIEGWVPLVHLIISNLKAWIHGTYHGAVRKKHLQEYLDEYVYRFNRRFWSMSAFRTLLQIGTQVGAVTYADQYAGHAAVRENPETIPSELMALFEENSDVLPEDLLDALLEDG